MGLLVGAGPQCLLRCVESLPVHNIGSDIVYPPGETNPLFLHAIPYNLQMQLSLPYMSSLNFNGDTTFPGIILCVIRQSVP